MKGELGEKGVKGLRGPARYVFLLKSSNLAKATQKSANLFLLSSQKIQNIFKSIRIISETCLNLHKSEIEHLLLCLV